MNKTSHDNRICPSLGLADDADTSLDFPSNWNYCHRCLPIAPPRFKHQEEFCLGGKYGECPLFLSQQVAPLSKDLRIPRNSFGDMARRNFRRNIVLALVVLIAILIGGWGITHQGLSAPVTANTPQTASPFVDSDLTISPPSTIAVLQIPSIMTLTPISFNTPTDTTALTAITNDNPSKNQLEILIGTDYKFVIHKILQGESMIQFSEKYDTSVEAIVAVNYTKGNLGWSGTLLVIPVGITDFSKLPSFVVYRVQEKDRGVSAATMAKYLRVTELELKYYNGWTDDGDRPLVGDYLLVPRARPTQ